MIGILIIYGFKNTLPPDLVNEPPTDLAEEQEDEQSNKRQRIEEGKAAKEGKIAEEDEDSEPSDGEDD